MDSILRLLLFWPLSSLMIQQNLHKSSSSMAAHPDAARSDPLAVAVSAALKPSVALGSDSVIVRGHDFSECARDSVCRNEVDKSVGAPYANATDLASRGNGATSATDDDVGRFGGNASVDYSKLMSSLLTTGFQATCLGQAIQLVDKMVSYPLFR